MNNLLGVPFEKVDGKGIMLSDLSFSNPKGGLGATSADQIKLWVVQEDGGYDYDTWYLNTSGVWKRSGDSKAVFENEYPNGLPAGTALWYKAKKRSDGAGTVTTSGGVVNDEWVDYTLIRNEYNFISFPYPVAFDPTDSNMVDWGDYKGGLGATSADQIKLWVLQEDGSYDYEVWYINTSGVWKKSGDSKATWAGTHPNGVTVGTGFWYKAYTKAGSDSFTVRFKSPLAKSVE